MAAKVIPVSLQEDVSQFGHQVANELFGNNFSAFVTFLISNYRAGNSVAPVKNSIKKEPTNQLGSFLGDIEGYFDKE